VLCFVSQANRKVAKATDAKSNSANTELDSDDEPLEDLGETRESRRAALAAAMQAYA
jgi:hypothetical protein